MSAVAQREGGGYRHALILKSAHGKRMKGALYFEDFVDDPAKGRLLSRVHAVGGYESYAGYLSVL